jgi:DNA-binding transcriptional ArsR family regulator
LFLSGVLLAAGAACAFDGEGGGGLVELAQVVDGELHGGGGEVLGEALVVAGSGDGHDPGPLGEQPGQGDLGGCGVDALGDLVEEIDNKPSRKVRRMTIALDEERLTDTFAALANSTRRALLARLAEGEATVNELAEPFNMTLPAVSKHLKVLERAGLVIRGRQAQFRPCALDAEPLRDVSSWTEQYRHLWEARFDRMDDYLKKLATTRTNRRSIRGL